VSHTPHVESYFQSFLTVAGFLRLAESGCGNKNYTQEFGSASCTEKNNATGKFSWVFEPPANRTDLVFALKFIHYHDTFVGKVAWSSEMFLPDGKLTLPQAAKKCSNRKLA